MEPMLAKKAISVSAGRRWTSVLVLVALIVAWAPPLPGSPSLARAQADVVCHRFASATRGDDAKDGSRETPVQSIRVLASRLRAGETGCLASGERFFFHQGLGTVEASGAAGNPITLRSEAGPNGRATVTGQVWIRGDDVTLTGIDFRGLGGLVDPISPHYNPEISPRTTHLIVHGDRVKLVGNDITSPKGICITIGNVDPERAEAPAADEPRADRFVLDGNRIHGCGLAHPHDELNPATHSGVHGVYIAHALDAVIKNNYIFDNRVRGIQLYPKAEGTIIENNVLHRNGGNLNIGSCWQNTADCRRKMYSRGAIVRNNIITNSTFGFYPKTEAQVWGNFPGPVGEPGSYENSVTGNCLFSDYHAGNRLYDYHTGQAIDASDYNGGTWNDNHFGGSGYAGGLDNNTVADPIYLSRDPAAASFLRLAANSPCRDKGPQDDGGTGPTPTVTNVEPDHGPGGTRVTITGSGFEADATTVTFGAESASQVECSSTECVATSPPADESSTVHVRVTVDGRTSAVNGPDDEYHYPPTLTGLSPNTKPAGAAAFALTLAGARFGGAAKVVWDGDTELEPTQRSATALTVTVPANLVAAARTYQVTVMNGSGTVSNALPFTATAGPTPPRVFFRDDFESNDLTKWTTSEGVKVAAVRTATGGTNRIARAVTPGNAATFVRTDVVGGKPEVYVRTQVKLVSQRGQVNLLSVRTAGASLYTLYVIDGKLFGRNWATQADTTTGTALLLNRWYSVQLHVKTGAEGRVDVWLNGAPVAELSKAQNLGATPVGAVQLGEHVPRAWGWNVGYDNVVASTACIGSCPAPAAGAKARTAATR